jgi:hypothetical protein
MWHVSFVIGYVIWGLLDTNFKQVEGGGGKEFQGIRPQRWWQAESKRVDT